MKVLGNIIWLLFGGIFTAVGYILSSIPFFISIVGIPFGIQLVKLGGFALWPFGKTVISKPQAQGCLTTFLNIIWIFIGGIWISLSHVLFGILFAITIIGIPFANQHFKMAGFILTPFGREVVNTNLQ